jgi:hypothetical protein
MILILWSFILLVLFASPDFGQVHSQLVILAFLLPILVLILGFLGDVFQHGGLSDSLSRRLQKIRCGLRLWWIGGGLLCFCCFMFLPHWFDACHVWIAAIFFFLPIITIFSTVWICFRDTGDLNIIPHTSSRIAVCQWAVYSFQWATFISQCWVFIWTIRPDVLGVSLTDVLLGRDYFASITKFNSQRPWSFCGWANDLPFPQGGIYFVFMITLVAILVGRGIYRYGQITDKAYKKTMVSSTALIALPLLYISILSFAHTVYPYIPYEKGGGDYTENPPVYFNFNLNGATRSGIPGGVPSEVVSNNGLSNLIVLDLNSSSVFVANTNDAGGPGSWRTPTNRPRVFEIRRENISCITYLNRFMVKQKP